ncbi:MAG TPA: secondary thiamine-phosphate synthase enzyme YjbQ [Chloroflexota bacterium]|nr:secondary thiamine-phosphate synthase enzyme YjbQ [Chloroflexota bacterium]
MLSQFSVRTNSRDAMVDVTDRVRGAITASGVRSGVCHVLVPHTTAGVTINESTDPGVVRDLLTYFDRIVPWESDWTHNEPNAAAHVKAAMVGSCATLAIDDGKLLLGPWQAIFFCEFDGPRERTIVVKVIAG